AGPEGSAVAAPGSGKALALVGEAGVLVGGFMLRYLVIMAALAVAFA
ncbi:oxidoreductase, partial [Gordonibacter sp. ResAG-50]|nr:oxidoreductase [Gordonibacter urolithinfaciens]